MTAGLRGRIKEEENSSMQRGVQVTIFFLYRLLLGAEERCHPF